LGVSLGLNLNAKANKKPDYSEGFNPETETFVSFTENKGQVHDQNYKARPDVLFSGTDGQLIFHLKNNGISYQLNKTDSWKEVTDNHLKGKRREVDQSTIYRLDINWLNANTHANVSKGKAYQGFNNYYLETCPNGALNVQSFEEVTYQNIYSGIDLKWYQKDGHLKYDYMVAAGANYENIQLELKGATAIKLNLKGELVISTLLGDIIEQAPLVIQNKKKLKAKWQIHNNVLSFKIESINPKQAFVIDPVVRVWGTYYGGTDREFGNGCATDANNNVYLAGYTYSYNGTAIATTGAYQTILGGNLDAFLAKFDANGVRLWGTYYGGAGIDFGQSCATDASGNVYLTGSTDSTTSNTIMVTAGTHQTTYGGGSDSGTTIATSGAHQVTYGGEYTDGFLVKFTDNYTGITESGHENTTWKIYPNPSKNIVNIELESFDKTIDILIINTLGQTVLQQKAVSTKTEIDLSKLQSGTYFVKLGLLTKKIIKE
ncbi:MAG: T9SS type A sorting domain-containing protein, partial [Bacteroidetes bacterium]|nr:T9SS type A sorting domain-containing protein [Bacteroidota bacterium]